MLDKTVLVYILTNKLSIDIKSLNVFMSDFLISHGLTILKTPLVDNFTLLYQHNFVFRRAFLNYLKLI
jgi:hypothetical protein